MSTLEKVLSAWIVLESLGVLWIWLELRRAPEQCSSTYMGRECGLRAGHKPPHGDPEGIRWR